MKSKKRQVIKLLKQNQKWKLVKEKYKHKQMRLVFSKIALIFNPNIEINKLIEGESKMLEAKKDQQETMFLNIFSQFEKITNEKANWKSFAKYLWYVFQTSTYWKDKKQNIENIFIKNNYIKMNQTKRKYLFEWMHSMDVSDSNYNHRITRTLKELT